MRLDHLGFTDYLIWLCAIIILLVMLPFLFFCCDFTGRNAYIFSVYEPFITRLLFFASFEGMLQIIDQEREQCHANQERIQQFTKTNVCGDEYSRVDTYAVSEKLSKSETILDAIDLSIKVAIVFLAIEFFGMCCFHYYYSRGNSSSQERSAHGK